MERGTKEVRWEKIKAPPLAGLLHFFLVFVFT